MKMKQKSTFLWRSLCTILVLICGSYTVIAQTNVGIGTTTPDASAKLDVTSTTQGLLSPRMTTAQRNAITSPAKGLMIFNTTTNQVEVNTGSSTSPTWAGGGIGSATLYSADGTLSSARTVTMGSNSLTFNGTGGITLNAGTLTVPSVASTAWNTNSLIISDGTGGLASMSIGTNGQVLKSNGFGPVWGTITAESTTADNGLTLNGAQVKLGGTLTETTTIGQGANNLIFTGTGKVYISSLAAPAWNQNSIIISDGDGKLVPMNAVGTSGQVLTSNGFGPIWSTINAESTTAGNGLTLSSSQVKLGGSLSEATTISQGANLLAFSGTGGINLNSGRVYIPSASSPAWNMNALTISDGDGKLAAMSVGTAGQYLSSNGYGPAWTSGSPSDGRLKFNVVNIQNALNRVMALNPITYNWKDSTKMGSHGQMGFIAQEMESVVPEVVYTEKGKNYGLNDLHTIKYDQLTALLAKAIQEQQVQIEILKSDNKKLMAQIDEINEMKEALAQLRAAMNNSNTAITVSQSFK